MSLDFGERTAQLDKSGSAAWTVVRLVPRKSAHDKKQEYHRHTFVCRISSIDRDNPL